MRYILLFLIFLSIESYSQSTGKATIAPCGNQQFFCVNNSKYILCMEVTVPADHCPITEYEINWGDGTKEPFKTTIPKSTTKTVIKHEHEYNLEDFLKSCEYEREMPVRLTTTNQVGCQDPQDIAPYLVFFRNYPKTKFASNPSPACIGQRVNFNNQTCPTVSTSYQWEYGDGKNGKDAFYTYNTVGAYQVSLAATNPCGTVSTTNTINIIDKAKAMIADSGSVSISLDTSIVCFSAGGVIRLDGVVSQNATSYQWVFDKNGDIVFLDKTDRNSGKPKIKFSKPGIYTITLTVNNSCNIPSSITCFHKVLDLPSPKLPSQPDACEPIKYKVEKIDGVSYTLDGNPLSPNIEQNLGLRDAPYIVTASLSNACGNQKLIDTFYVSLPKKVKITNPKKASDVCLNDTPILLETDITGGTWQGNNIETQAGKKYFNPKSIGNFTIIYSKGVGKCSTSDTITINVNGVSITANDISACLGATIIKLNATPAGGSWTTAACTNCISGDSLQVNKITTPDAKLTYSITSTDACKATKEISLKIGKPKADFSVRDGCGGTNATIINTSTGATNYQWYLNGNAISVATNPSFPLPSGSAIIKLIATASGCQDSTSRQLTIATAPNAVSFSVTNAIGCSPLSVSFSPIGTKRADVNYSWNFGNNSTSNDFQPTAQIFRNQGEKQTDYTITLTARNTCGTQTYTSIITVRPLAKAEVGIDSTLFRCSPAKVKFTNRSTGHGSSSVWNFGDGTPLFSSSADTLSKSFSAKDSTKTFRIILTVENQCGKDHDTVSIKVIPPKIKPFFTMSASEICPKEIVKFRDASVPKPKYFLWKFGDGEFSPEENPEHPFKIPNTTFTVTLLAITECGSDSVQRKIIVKKGPDGDFKLVSDFSCQDQNVVFTNLSKPSDTNIITKFYWNFGDNTPIDSTVSPTHIYTTEGKKTIKMTIIGTSPSCKNEITKTIDIRAKTEAAFKILSDSVCSIEAIKVNNLSKNANKFKWIFSDGRSFDTQIPPETSFPPGTYDVFLSANYENVCKDSIKLKSAFTVLPCEVNFPEAFTPNGDGIGDRWNLFGSGIKQINHIRIRNRWGEIVFEAQDSEANTLEIGKCWDGKFNDEPVPIGVYICEYEVAFVGGVIEKGVKKISLIRR